MVYLRIDRALTLPSQQLSLLQLINNMDIKIGTFYLVLFWILYYWLRRYFGIGVKVNMNMYSSWFNNCIYSFGSIIKSMVYLRTDRALTLPSQQLSLLQLINNTDIKIGIIYLVLFWILYFCLRTYFGIGVGVAVISDHL